MQVSKYLVRARVLVAALPLITALTAALMGVAVLAFGASPAAAQEQTGGAVVAWGYNGQGQTNVPSGLGSVKAISAGSHHSMAIGDVSSPPVAVDDSYNTVDEDGTLNVAAPGVLDNDTDPDAGDTLNAVVANDVQYGTLTLNPNGSFTYTPDANYNGTDTFTYTANDGTANSNVATVSITVNAVNDAPVAKADTKTTDEDTALSFPSSDLVSNDDDGAANESTQILTVKEVFNGTHGTVSLGNDGNITFTPEADFSGQATFDYRVCDNGSPSQCSVQTATVNVTVNAVNDAPVAVNDSATTDEDKAKDINVITNDTDVDSTNAELSVSSFTQPTHGTVTQNAEGTLKYNPAANYNGPDSFTYKANDGSLDSNVATVSITVKAVNDAPVADDQSVTTNEDTAKTVTFGASDVEGNALSYTIVTGPSHGTLTLHADGSFTYKPNLDYSGIDSFTYKVCDQGGPALCSTAKVRISVSPMPDACTIRGTSKDDVLRGTAHRDVICGREGNDTIRGLEGNDLIRGGKGNDTLYGDANNDTLYGGAGTDLLNGGSGTDFTQQ